MSGHVVDRIQSRLVRPFSPVGLVQALTGVPSRIARQVVSAHLAASTEAEALLEAMPHIVRSLAIATTDHPARCHGEVRGPVLWSETMSARAASAGDPGLFVCATTAKAFDTDENRVLKAALAAISRAGRDCEVPGRELAVPEELRRRARLNSNRADHFLGHRTLSDVPAAKVRARSLTRTRAGHRRGTYRPAVDLLDRAGRPVDGAALDPIIDPLSRPMLELFADVLDALDERAGAPMPLRSTHGRLVAGPVSYEPLAGVGVGRARVRDLPAALAQLRRSPLDAAPEGPLVGGPPPASPPGAG